MTDSVPARVAGPRLRRLVTRLLMLAGVTAAGWLASVLFAGTASADTGLPINISLPGVSTQSTPAKKPAKKTPQSSQHNHQQSQGLLGLGGLVGGLLNTVGDTVQTVTSTVSTVTTTVTTTVGQTVGAVVHTVTEIPQKVVPPAAVASLPPVVPVVEEAVDNILQPTHSGSATTESATATVRTEVAPAEVAAAPPVVAVAQPEVVEHAAHPQRRPATQNVTSQVSTSLEKAAPSDRGPSPLPVPGAPAAPAAPAPSLSSGNDGGAGARNALATLTSQARLAPPPFLGRLDRGHPVAERGRMPGLPVTTPD